MSSAKAVFGEAFELPTELADVVAKAMDVPPAEETGECPPAKRSATTL